MIIYNNLDNYFFASAVRQTFLGFEMTANLRDTSPLIALRVRSRVRRESPVFPYEILCEHNYFDEPKPIEFDLLYVFLSVRITSPGQPFPRKQTVTEGNPFTLQCRPLWNTSKFNVTWITNSESNTSFPISLNLTVNATRFDAGEHHCTVTNGVESVKLPAVYVAVLCKYVSTAD